MHSEKDFPLQERVEIPGRMVWELALVLMTRNPALPLKMALEQAMANIFAHCRGEFGRIEAVANDTTMDVSIAGWESTQKVKVRLILTYGALHVLPPNLDDWVITVEYTLASR